MTDNGSEQIGAYRILKRIGHGAMGQVCLAEQVHLRKKYALKILDEAHALDGDFGARFHDAARVTGELRHPNIVQVHHVGVDRGRWFLVTDYVTGPEGRPLSLDDRLGEQGRDRPGQQEVRMWAIEIAEALAYAHKRGLVHRDIKPGNVLIDSEGHVKLTDFGLAEAMGSEFVLSQLHRTMQQTLSQEETRPAEGTGASAGTVGFAETVPAGDSPGSGPGSGGASGIFGTYDYMAPEQRGEGTGRIDGRTDIYSFGVLLYRLLTGKRPTGMARPASQVAKGVSKAWDRIIDRCMEYDPADRYPSAEALVADLRKVGAGRRRVSLGVAVAAVVVAVAIVVAYFQGSRPLAGPKPASDTADPVGSSTASTAARTAVSPVVPGNVIPVKGQAEIVWERVKAVQGGQRPAAARPTKEIALDLGKGLSIKLAMIPAGKFMMGSPDGEAGRADDEGPQHEVAIAKSFYMGTHEVTQEQYRAVKHGNPSHRKAPKNPVEQVSWRDAVSFCRDLSRKVGREVRLPTEAEWEYACRAGTTTAFNTGWTITADQANYNGNFTYGGGSKGAYRKETVPVGRYVPNAWGLYDMHGNVYEWCSDWYGRRYYAIGKPVDPQGPVAGTGRVARGGGWYDVPRICRSAFRGRPPPDFRGNGFGFRVAMDVANPAARRRAILSKEADEVLRPRRRADKGPRRRITLDLGQGLSMKFVEAPGGKFLRGPQKITITRPFYIGICEVTQEQYQAVMGKNPSYFKAPKHPVEQVSWHDAVEFCRDLSAKVGKTVRLPTEAEWGYALRPPVNPRLDVPWPRTIPKKKYDGDYAYASRRKGVERTKTAPVDSFDRNRLNLFGMDGNVYEWCSDWHDRDYYAIEELVDPQGPAAGTDRVLRGGGWHFAPKGSRSGNRFKDSPDYRYRDIGFRVVLDLK